MRGQEAGRWVQAGFRKTRTAAGRKGGSAGYQPPKGSPIVKHADEDLWQAGRRTGSQAC